MRDLVTIAKILPWPLPEGIFTNGKEFHPLVFLETARLMYQQLVEENRSFNSLDLELQSFCLYFSRRIISQDGEYFVAIPMGMDIDEKAASFIVKQNGEQFIRVDCFQDDGAAALAAGDLFASSSI